MKGRVHVIPESALASFIAALFSMMNPIGNVGVFAGMTADRPGNQARRIACTCAVAIAITLLIVARTGSLLLEFFGITVDSLRDARPRNVTCDDVHNPKSRLWRRQKENKMNRRKLQLIASTVIALALPCIPTALAQDFEPEYVGGYPTAETAERMFEEYDYQAAVQFNLRGYAYLNSLGMTKGFGT